MTTVCGAVDQIRLVGVKPAARELVAGLMSEPWGQVSPSVYETGRLVTLAPRLTGHGRRLRWLLEAQRPDGGWSAAPHNGYALVPTLSATEAMLGALRTWGRYETTEIDHGEVVDAADRGLRTLFRWLAGDLPIPDMPAIELIVPSLIELINGHLTDLRDAPVPGLGRWQDTVSMRPPRGMDNAAVGILRARLGSGSAVPAKLLHALEVVGEVAAGLSTVHPECTGTVGASPAATAAWLGHGEISAAGDPARRHLEAVIRRYEGPVPCGIPVTIFERAWVLSWLTRAGIHPALPPGLVASLRAALGPAGLSAAAGLPPDADTTAGALYALSLLDAPHPPDVLWAYETETHFCTWPGEDGRSVTTNAHVLEAFGHYVERTGDGPLAARYTATAAKVASWLRAQQDADGSWRDRWHASPYYATVCCALALHRFGGAESALAVERAVRWVLGTQHSDGSWGCWGGTDEETAYALHVLLLTGAARREDFARVVARGGGYLRSRVAASRTSDNQPLWHDKDLYHPIAIVRAAVLVALHLTQGEPTGPTGANTPRYWRMF